MNQRVSWGLFQTDGFLSILIIIMYVEVCKREGEEESGKGENKEGRKFERKDENPHG